MQNQDVMKRHAALVDRMANTLGIDLEESAMRGDLDIEEIGDAVLRCTGCTNPDHCGQWLNENPTADNAVGYCRNTALFERLKG
ncbi:MAG: DUF6455 family protein [Marinibacterium sp.]|nr:DUF6455 family protein [Marinibacterium sp.]